MRIQIKSKKIEGILLRRLVPVALAIGALISLQNAIFRPLWYDEALTVMEFLPLQDYWGIYTAYQIPNNQIVFTLVLRLWTDIWEKLLPIPDFSFRLPSLILSIICVTAAWRFWSRRMPTAVVVSALVALICSPAFEIYGVAARGYMLSMTLGVFALEYALRLMEARNTLHFALFCILAFALVGVMPTNVLLLAAVSLTALPYALRRKSLFLWMSLPCASAICLLVFYTPIARKFIKALSLPEGWSSSGAAALHLYGALALLAPALLLMGLAGTVMRRHRIKTLCRGRLWWIVALLIPLAPMLLRSPSPFPRVFFVFLMLLLFMLGASSWSLLAFSRLRLGNGWTKVFGALLIALSIGLGLCLRAYSPNLSAMLTPQNTQDDFFHPYFVDNSFDPRNAAATCANLSSETPGAAFFLSSGADPVSLVFYGKLFGISDMDWLMDRPNRPPLDTLPLKYKPVYIVVHRESDLEQIKNRFGIMSTVQTGDFGFQKIYYAKNYEN